MIHVVASKATPEELREMLQQVGTYIKLAVDVRRRVLAGGGAMHSDCEAALLEDGSEQVDIWGADWVPESKEVRYESLINLRPKQGNRAMTINDPDLRKAVEAIVRERLSV
jgi:hypothetical protein